MTREECIEWFKTNPFYHENHEPFNMAIEALKAQLSAKDTTLGDVSTAYENGYQQGKFEALQWIPVSEKLPSNDDFVIVTVLDERGDTPYRYSDFGWYLDRADCWIIDAEQRTDVIAWMPLLEPYKENES